MVSIKITYDGREYGDIKDAVYDAIVAKVSNKIKERLSPFESEIEASGGNVEIEISRDYKSNRVLLNNMPEELISRIRDGLKG